MCGIFPLFFGVRTATVLLAATAWSASRVAQAAAVAAPAPAPAHALQTELIAPLEFSRLQVGATVLVRVDYPWRDPSCVLHPGSIVKGHVTSLVKRLKQVKDMQVEIGFGAADCDGHPAVDLPLTLVAVMGMEAPGVSSAGSGLSEAPPLADAIGNPIGGPGGIRSARAASAINSAMVMPARQVPREMFPGQVLNMRKTTLRVGSGEGDGSVLTAVGHDLRLEPGTVFVLRHDRPVAAAEAKGFHMSGTGGGGSELVATQPSRPDGGKAAANTTPVPMVAPAEESEICSASCHTVTKEQSSAGDSDRSAVSRIGLSALGYKPHEAREVTAFDADTTLTFLNATTLLCTFDPHQLRERAGGGEETNRTVRAVLIDTGTHVIKRVVEWRVRGDGQYLWRLPDGNILVHIGHELRVFDARLKPIRSLPAEGPVAWVVVSPSGNHIAVGTVHERYSAEVRRELTATLAEAPEEDIDVRVYGSGISPLVSTVQSSKLPVPVLSETGELRLHGDGHTHWTVSDVHWNRTEQKVASFKSTCRPSLSMPQPGLLFAVGCTATGDKWFRMLRPDGHPLLKGEASSSEIEQAASASRDKVFAVRTIQAVRSMSNGQPFRRADLLHQRIATYRFPDGKPIAKVSTLDFALSELAFALSPGGDQLALVGSDAISFYKLDADSK